MIITRDQLAHRIDATALSPELTPAGVGELIAGAAALGVRGICVPPSLLHAAGAAAQEGLVVTTVCGFPSGKHHVLVKAAEARLAVQFGAVEVGMVVDVAAAQAGDSNALISEIAAVREAIPHPARLTVIVESAALRDDALSSACLAARAAGADNVATSTGFHESGGATVHAVALMRDVVGGQVGVVATAEVCTWDDATALVSAGASRLGVTAAQEILAGAPG